MSLGGISLDDINLTLSTSLDVPVRLDVLREATVDAIGGGRLVMTSSNRSFLGIGSSSSSSSSSNIDVDVNVNVNVNVSEQPSTDNCTNDYCIPDEDYIALIEAYIFPTRTEWILIGMHCLVFVVGLVGNFLVCLAVYRNQSMHTVTNYFIVNLAVADFLVVLVCLPPTVLWDVTETWFFGSALCKTVLYVQSVSISVSVLTLTFISVDRWYAICFPLKFKSTTGRAQGAIFVIWLFSMSLVFPELLVLDTRARQRLRVITHYFTDCTASWSDETQKTYQIVLLLLLYVAPFILMSIAYHQIIRVLWKNEIPGNSESKVITTCKSSSSKKGLSWRPNTSSDGQIRSRRKAAKMLIAVVAMFGICYFPVHLLNLLRYSMELPQNEHTVTVSLISHWLCYANSAMNPVIYNFMSGKFRKEFIKAFKCIYCRQGYREECSTHSVSQFRMYSSRLR